MSAPGLDSSMQGDSSCVICTNVLIYGTCPGTKTLLCVASICGDVHKLHAFLSVGCAVAQGSTQAVAVQFIRSLMV